MATLQRLIIGMLVMILALTVHAGVYKWVDEQGRVHYGDKPVSGKAKELDIKVSPASTSPAPASSRKDLQQRFLRAREEERKERQQAQAKKKQKRAEARRKCERAKKEYEKYRHASSIYVKGENGERKHLSFKEREAYEQELAGDIKKWCGR